MPDARNKTGRFPRGKRPVTISEDIGDGFAPTHHPEYFGKWRAAVDETENYSASVAMAG